MVERSTEVAVSAPSLGQWGDGEVSLRQLYLTLKAGVWLILGVALVCASIAFIIVSSSDLEYVSTATVTVTPPAIGFTSLTGLEVSVPATLDFDTYRSIAFDPALLETVDAPSGSDVVTLVGRLDLVSRVPASQGRGHVTVDHVVTGGTAGFTRDDAARVANSWASATALAVTSFITAPVNDTIETIAADTVARIADFNAASDAWAEFLGVDERRSLNERLDAITRLESVQRVRIAMLEGSIEAADARIQALRTEIEGGSSASAAPSQLVVDQLTLQVGERAAMQAERDQIASVVQQTAGDASSLRARVANLESTAARLQRDLAAASMSFYQIAPVVPSLQLQRDLAAHSATVAVPAVAALQSESRGRLVATVAAAAVGALLSTLLVLLRAAVRDPEA